MTEAEELSDNLDSDPTDDSVNSNSVGDFTENLNHRLQALDPLRRLESVLFLAKEPLHSRKLSQLAGLQDGTQARTMVKQLNQEYNESGRAFVVTQVAGGFQVRTRPMFSDWLKKLQNSPTAIKLSGPAMETLAVVAYRQPVLKADIEAIRGVSCGELLRQLLDRGLVRISGRSEELGNPFLYATTRRFLELFGLANIETLPRGDRLKGNGMPDWSSSTSTDTTVPDEFPENKLNDGLDENDLNSQNMVDPKTPTNQLPLEDPEQE